MIPTEPGINWPQSTPASRPGCGSYAILIAVGAWILLVTVLAQIPTWVFDNLRIESGEGLAGWIWMAVTWGEALLIAVVVVPLALLTRWPRLRATYTTWALAAGGAALLAIARVFSILELQQTVVAQLALGLAGAAILLLAARLAGRSLVPGGRLLSVALALAALISLPSLIWGALGSPLDAVLQLAAGLAFGLLNGVLLAGWLFGAGAAGPDRGTQNAGRAWSGRGERALSVFGAGTTLFILASAYGMRGSQFLFLIALPPLGITIAALEAWHKLPALTSTASGDISASPPASFSPGAWLPAAALVGVVAAGLGMFWDPSELSLVLGADDILGWALRAAEVSLVLAAVLGLIIWIFLNRSAQRIRAAGAPAALNAAVDAQVAPSASGATSLAAVRTPNVGRWWIAAMILAWVVAGAAYLLAGQPGFYGEEFFVILRDQADVRAAYQIPDRTQRLSYIYKTLTQHANQTQAPIRKTLDARGIGYQPYYLVNGLQVNGGPQLRAYLAAQPEVDRILNSPRLRPLPEPPAPARGDLSAPTTPPWGITTIGADRVWQDLHVKGQGVVIGQSDSGVQGDHPALAGTYRGRQGGGREGGDNYNWLDPWNHTKSPTDIGGHGTHTLGTMLGQGGIGVAPEAEWMACVNLARNLGNPAWYLNCMQFMLAPYPQNGDPLADGDPSRAAHVLNNSWGCPPIEGCDPGALSAAAGALRAAGIYVVASAGNGGPACSTVSDPIALYGDVLSVGAIAENGELAPFSSRGPVTADGSDRVKPDVVAPGVDVVSSFPNSTYASESGTSMAGPHVAGVVALMWSAQPKLIGNIDRTTQILIDTARPYTGTLDSCSGNSHTPNNDAGYGIVDAYAAVQAALAEK
jgi:subtilisin family serine protease